MPITPTRTTPFAIHTHALSKQFHKISAVQHVNMMVPSGSVYGLLGPGAAGKSTLLRMVLGMMTPSTGSIEVLGQPLTRRSARSMVKRIGAVLDGPPGYDHLTAQENMHIVQDMLGLTPEQVDRAFDAVRLTPHRKKLVKSFSLGMRQRLGIAMAIARDPELLILDEPMNGLDPAGSEEIRLLLVQLAKRGVTVVVTSHRLEEVDMMASHIGIMFDGALIFQGSKDELTDHILPDLLVETSDRTAAVSQINGAIPVPGGILVRKVTPVESAKVIQRLALAGVPIYEVRRIHRSLEEVFLNLTAQGEFV